MCLQNGCKKRGYYNFLGADGKFCSEHKLEGMVNVKDKKCEHPDCETRPNYNLTGETKARFCNEHKTEGMVDIKNKKCEHFDCSKQPNYNLPGETRGRFCNEHKTEGMVDVKSKMCKTPLCDTRATDKYKGYCLRCFMYTFPNEPVTRNYKTKETATVDKIREEFEEKVDLTTDKIVAGGCSKRRPDCYIDLAYQVIIIEVDENQHTDYDCSCENKRTMELSRDFGHRPIVFIRFNPDKYILDGKVITSCWGTNKKGITTVKKSKVKEWNTRLNTLIDTIKYWIEPENKTNKTVEVIQLYYDND